MANRLKWMLLVLVCGCSSSSVHGQPVDSGLAPDAIVARACAVGDSTKIAFTSAQGCANDGSVEFCLPANDQAARSRVTAVSSSISCAPGGGRAMCNSADLVLCTFPTTFPTQCQAMHGAMTAEVWMQMCSLSAIDQIHQIVPTFAE